ncbi:ankyrin repeat and LEM domain-containing protein 1 [Papilio machaon]|uniref:ankyrin repeat and LEM domain-containing protein 1 n=1 Tax=Papilio machaon TaxID=76193 RepID=UPI001E6635A7|nr:ankyrin repeat and LEM domain-containing protein 1 [Papilio machaon]
MGATYKQLFKLYDLIQSGDIRSIKPFLENESIEINDILPCKGIGILHLAVGIDPVEKSKECTEIILKHGGNPNLCNEDGITPVHIAAIWGRLDNLKLLIGCGGEPSLRDLDGLSAFDYAVREQQWEVYDYLHNVEDQLDDSITSPCAYSLDLDRVLVTTDQMVAEYKPTTDNQTNNTTIRKSDLVRDWCEKTSLVMNKLYPTILNETYSLLENESEPWNIDTTNLTIDLSKEQNPQTGVNETNYSFKTCLTNGNDVEISGIQRLDKTIDKTSTQPKQRYSVYENFSLPGSPKCITHKNYNTKTSLKKTKRNDLCPRMQNLTLDQSNSLLTDDASVMDKAMAVVQNRTNEWLSSCSSDMLETRACNTRRSSASSGVSSNYSGGNIIIANVHEEYKYEDKEEGVVLIEKRLLLSPVVLPVDEADMTTPDQTILSVASSLPSTMDYDVNTLRSELMKLGFTPGPIHENTKTLYLKKLQTLKKTPIVVTKEGKSYSVELQKSIRSSDWLNDLTPYIELEKKARADFANPNKKWREGTTKTSFTYLLLDPRLTDNLPLKANKQNPHELWGTFINSIFYVGKGKRSRPYSHLYQALTLWKRDFKTSNDKKVQQILDIWSDKVGVICLHIFQNVIPAEAFTYEAAMIDVLGLQNLKNIKSGNYYGVAASWPLKERRMLGLYLLYKAMQIFLTEGERQLRPDDID